jgi:hypothetical protein
MMRCTVTPLASRYAKVPFSSFSSSRGASARCIGGGVRVVRCRSGSNSHADAAPAAEPDKKQPEPLVHNVDRQHNTHVRTRTLTSTLISVAAVVALGLTACAGRSSATSIPLSAGQTQQLAQGRQQTGTARNMITSAPACTAATAELPNMTQLARYRVLQARMTTLTQPATQAMQKPTHTAMPAAV